MARGKKAAKALTLEEKLERALVPEEEQPYVIPENWCWTSVGNLSSLYRGVSYKKNDVHTIKENCDCLIMRGGNIGEGYIDIGTDNVYVSKSLVNDNQLVCQNDIIIVASTGSTKVIGRAGVSRMDYLDVSFGAFLMLVRSKNKLNAKYLDYFFQTDDYRIRIRNLASGVNINNIRAEYITSMPIPFPPLLEQQRIVRCIESLFAKLDEAKEKAQVVIDSFELRKSAILHKAFTGELTERWRKKYGVELDSWISVFLSDVCKVNPKKLDTKNLPDDLEVSFFPMSSLSETYGEITEPQTKILKEVRTGFTNFLEGDVVFAKITPCMENGKSAIIGKLVNNIGYGTTEFYVLRCEKKIYNRYMYHLVRDQYFRDQAKAVMTGAVGQQRVPKDFMETYPLKLPTVIEQHEICRILDEIFFKEMKIKQAAESVLAQIDTMKKAILARAFRGELGTNNPSDENAIELLKKVLAEKN